MDRETGVPVGEGGVVLLDQQGGRHQDRHLLAVHHRLERGAHRDLGLAVADVAADQPVHRDHLLHVLLDLFDRGQLVRGLDEVERVLQLALPGRVGGERVAAGGLPGGVQLDQLGGDLADGPAGPALALDPVGAAHPVQGRVLAADVAGHLVQRVHRHVEPVGRLAALGRGVLDHQVLPDRAGHAALHHLDVAADPVRGVHDRVAGGQLERVDLVLAADRHLAAGLVGGALPGQVAAVKTASLIGSARKPWISSPVTMVPMPASGMAVQRGQRPDRQLALGEHLGEPLAGALALGHQDDAPAVADPLGDVVDRRLRVAPVGLADVALDDPRFNVPLS